ncbi:MAG: tetratricopeptide repeat protein, partial [Deltaproteobacteria bacterium]|nr:tetratricopeptide repeat protein [Deltaproteobacteria bacterium]
MSLFDRVGRFLDDVVLLPEETRKSLEAAEQARRDALFPEAEALYADVLEVRPGLLRARVGLARVLAETGRLAEARTSLDQARREAPEDATVATLAAEWALSVGDA